MCMEELYKRWYKNVLNYSIRMTRNRYLADDIPHETFLKAYKLIDSIANVDSAEALLHTIAKHTYYNHLRSLKYIELVDDLDQEMSNFVDNCVENVDKSIDLERKTYSARQIVHNLDQVHQEVFFWRVYGELTFKQIAEIFGKSEMWASSIYYRTKRKILKEMEHM